MFKCLVHARCIEWFWTVKLIGGILMWRLDNSALLCQRLPRGSRGQYWKMLFSVVLVWVFFFYTLWLWPQYWQSLTHISSPEAKIKHTIGVTNKNARASKNWGRCIGKYRGTRCIGKTTSVESYLSRLKTNVVTHQTHMTHKPRFNQVSCLFSCLGPFFQFDQWLKNVLF